MSSNKRFGNQLAPRVAEDGGTVSYLARTWPHSLQFIMVGILVTSRRAHSFIFDVAVDVDVGAAVTPDSQANEPAFLREADLVSNSKDHSDNCCFSARHFTHLGMEGWRREERLGPYSYFHFFPGPHLWKDQNPPSGETE